MSSYQNEDVFLSLLVKVVCELRQFAELDFVISEVFLVLHVVNVGVLNLLKGKKRKPSLPGALCAKFIKTTDRLSLALIYTKTCCMNNTVSVLLIRSYYVVKD